ncbi:hypothetical protein ACSFA0_25525 [Variovorax sp. LT1P1]|uniref:hypothetical protein n=1 Tax=Variovorax sp. LT1P1 TaxID=3443730 RepID=UPI003F4543DB
MSQAQHPPLSGPAVPEAGFILRTIKGLNAWLTAQLEASDPVWSSDPIVSEFDALPKETTRR